MFISFTIVAITSCGKDDDNGDNTDNFENKYSFKIDGEQYNFNEFEITHDTVSKGPRVFIRKEVDGDFFNMNLLFEPGLSEQGMDWNGGNSFFFVRIDKGDFHTLDLETSKVMITELDTEKRRLKATFFGEGSTVFNSETIAITEGVLEVEY